jgi:hypothetical protein
MKRDDFERARNIMLRIEECEKMEVTLSSAVKDVKEHHNESDAEDLTQLIMKLSETKEGGRVIDHIAGTLMMRFREAKRELEQQFAEL